MTESEQKEFEKHVCVWLATPQNKGRTGIFHHELTKVLGQSKSWLALYKPAARRLGEALTALGWRKEVLRSLRSNVTHYKKPGEKVQPNKATKKPQAKKPAKRK